MIIKFKTKEERDIVLKRIKKVKNANQALNIKTADESYGFLLNLDSKIDRSSGNTPSAHLREHYGVYSVACSSGQFDTIKDLAKWHEIVSILAEVAQILNSSVDFIMSENNTDTKETKTVEDLSSFRSFLKD